MKKAFFSFWCVQFLGAFNDALFKTVVSFLGARLLGSAVESSGYISQVGFLFILPFLLFSPIAGMLADRFSKRVVIIWVKLAELLIMTFAWMGLYYMNLPILMVVIFLMATQSAFLSPAKYGIIPELVGDEVSLANGYLQMGTFMALILGTVIGAWLSEGFAEFPGRIGYILVAIAGLGVFASMFLPKLPARDEGVSFRSFSSLFTNIRIGINEIKRDKNLLLIIFSLTAFWAMAGFYQMNVIGFGIYDLGWSNTHIVGLLLLTAVGVTLGSIIAGITSRHRVDMGLVPLGAALISFSMVMFSFIRNDWILFLFALLVGIGAGFYTVPLNAYFQKNTNEKLRARAISVLNIMTSLGGILAAIFIFLLGKILRVSPSHLFLIAGLLWIGVTWFVLRYLPYAMFRMIAWLLMHSVYDLRVYGEKNIPEAGGALLVSNHISFIDGIIITSAIKRDVRFVMHKQVCKNKMVDFFRRISGSIILDPSSPKSLAKSLDEIADRIKQGELICLFPEGELTKTGNLMRFNKGVEYLLKKGISEIIPLYIDLMWGDIFTYARHRLKLRRPRSLPYRVILAVGRKSRFSSAYDVRLAVEEVGVEAFSYRADEEKKIHFYFIETAKKNPFRFCMADTTGRCLNYLQALTGALLIKQKLFGGWHRPRRTNEFVGILLPSSVTAALVNGAVLMAGKVPVNLNFTLSKDLLLDCIRQAAINKVITSRRFLKKIKIPEMDNMLFLEDINILWTERLWMLILCLLLPKGVLIRFFVDGDLNNVDDPATIIFSSGSTGSPKGVMLSHSNISSNVQAMYQIFDISWRDKIAGVLPFFHSFGVTATMCFPFGVGIGVVYHLNPLDARSIVKMIKDYKTTILMATPSFLSLYAKKAAPSDLSSLRGIIVGAEKLNRSFAEEFQRNFGIPIYEGYGATELSPITAVNIPNSSKSGSVGLPIPGVVVKIVSPDNNTDLGPNKEGLVIVKGANVMLGYLNNPDKTAEVIKDGWYFTGDIGYRDEDGFLFIVDRMVRFSKIGGEMVPHVKIEEEIKKILGRHESVCVVTAVKDEEKGGERLVVLLSVDVDVDELWHRLNASGLPKIWIPRKDCFFKVDELPCLGSGKIDLKRIKRMAEELMSARK